MFCCNAIRGALRQLLSVDEVDYYQERYIGAFLDVYRNCPDARLFDELVNTGELFGDVGDEENQHVRRLVLLFAGEFYGKKGVLCKREKK